MPSFSYKAVKDSGQQVTGVMTAENYQVALRLLEPLGAPDEDDSPAPEASTEGGGPVAIHLDGVAVADNQRLSGSGHRKITFPIPDCCASILSGLSSADRISLLWPLHLRSCKSDNRGRWLPDSSPAASPCRIMQRPEKAGKIQADESW